jgi:signal peptidase II
VIPVVALDAITKLVAENQLLRFAPVQVVSDVVQFRLVYNPGAAFGLNVGPHSRWVFFGLAVLALVVLGAMLRGTEAADKLRIVSLSLICAGAVGNLVDRIRSPQGVVDFIDVGTADTSVP